MQLQHNYNSRTSKHQKQLFLNVTHFIKGKGSVQLLMEFHLTVHIICHLTYGITECYRQPDTSEHTPP